MAYDRFLIAPLRSGLQTNLVPWQIPEDAFTTMQNSYLFRGRLRKRFGGVLMSEGAPDSILQSLWSRFSEQVGVLDGAGALVGNVAPINLTWPIGAMFSIGQVYYTVNVAGTPANMLKTNATVTATFNTSTGVFVFGGTGLPPATPVFFYPGLPVMGLTNYQVGFITNQPSFGFDTRRAYTFSAGRWVLSTGSPVWHGTDLNFFWTDNWEGITADITTMFTTNFFVTNPSGAGTVNDDPIWSYDTANTWLPFSYSSDATLNPGNLQPKTVTQSRANTGAGSLQIKSYVQTCKIIVVFKNRLLLLNTIENNANGTAVPSAITPGNYLTSTNTSYTNRCRYSHNGSPFASNAWLEPNFVYDDGTGAKPADGAGYIDAPTDEQIISSEFIKDRLIVYFERSTWELAYTGNEVLPFVWQKINTELGSEAEFSTVPFDKMVLTMGTTGVHACNGSNVERIDNKIPDQVFKIQNRNEGVSRVAGIRDYFVEQVYWTFPSSNKNAFDIYPNQVLVYDYKNGSWALNDDCITAFGYYEQQSDKTWASSTPSTWSNINATWSSGVNQAQFRDIIAGNQQGFVFIVSPDTSVNALVTQITDINIVLGVTQLSIINHNLDVGDFIYINSATGITQLNDTIFKIINVIDGNTIDIGPTTAVGIYTGGGFIQRVSQIDIQTKWFNPYIDKAQNVYIAKIDFGVIPTDAGSITVDYYPSGTSLSMLNAGFGSNSIMGNGILETSPYALYPLELEQDLLWHSIYLQSSGESIQLNLFLSDQEMLNRDSSFCDFEIQGMVLYTQAVGRLQ